MAGDSQKLNEGELALYSMHLSSGYIPVGVDLAARVFQVCYLNEKQKIKNKALSRDGTGKKISLDVPSVRNS